MQKNEVVKQNSKNRKDILFATHHNIFISTIYPKQLVPAPSWPAIGKIPLNDSPEDLANTLDFQKADFFCSL